MSEDVRIGYQNGEMRVLGLPEPSVGQTRLLRIEFVQREPSIGTMGPIIEATRGRWFTDNVEMLEAYRQDVKLISGGEAALKILDLPSDEALRHRADQLPERSVERVTHPWIGEDGAPCVKEAELHIRPLEYARLPRHDYFVSRELAERAIEACRLREPIKVERGLSQGGTVTPLDSRILARPARLHASTSRVAVPGRHIFRIGLGAPSGERWFSTLAEVYLYGIFDFAGALKGTIPYGGFHAVARV